ncbi:Phosphotransferase enzyme family protein [Soonwooa buanensis]|uniref:Phosphotransferase enzyme family protein n=1 Tax=Soonwooa buanensis TaxID=619805 RepID=A0A1T5FTD8_9FLAO|nr:aminoglycoside phosphotransferase family protein [Soonwooa buanensis]SKB99438.1 Phosphotransferase enzyme family protein [Soonwooa buanensis]
MESHIKEFFNNFCQSENTNIVALPQSGSSRKNYIASFDDKKYIITDNDNLRENEVFFYFTEIFSKLNLNTPKIFKISENRQVYIQEYLGEHTLSEIISTEFDETRIKSLAKKTLKQLFDLQQKSINKIDYTKTFDYEEYDNLAILHDLYYFKNFLVDVLEINYHKSKLLKEFQTITKIVSGLEPKALMIRDFQARNIMVDDKDNIFFIDYQGAMFGPLMYDVISFLYQAKANFSVEFKQEMLDYYISLFSEEKVREMLKTAINPIIMMRYLQVLGAYGFRGLIQRKKHFINSLDQGIKNIVELSTTWPDLQAYPELLNVIQQLETSDTKLKIKSILQ